jgi:hypothetical protein
VGLLNLIRKRDTLPITERQVMPNYDDYRRLVKDGSAEEKLSILCTGIK